MKWFFKKKTASHAISSERNEQILVASKNTALKMLRGQLTQTLNLAIFDEDIPGMAVRYLAEADPEWLMNQMADPNFELNSKLTIVLELNGSSHEAAWKATGYEGTLEEFLALVDRVCGILSKEE